MVLYKVEDKDNFKKRNLENWYFNSEFWLQAKMRHLEDVYDFTGEVISQIVSELDLNRKARIIDLGCGEGWIYRLLSEKGIESKYVGLDYNDLFIEANIERYYSEDVEFIMHDLEEPPPEKLHQYADIAINFFNFFEIPRIEKAFKNTVSMMSTNGILLIVNIDPIMQILSVSKTLEEFYTGLTEYELHGQDLGYDKDIDIGDSRSGRFYKSLLYSNATYAELAKKNKLKLYDYQEVVKTGNYVPQIYQFLFFKK